jgi:DNA-binding CsgD family transcriptional regulator
VTRQQIRIAELVALGMTNRQIAERLGCSPRTVGNTLSMLYARLGISTRAELAVLMVSSTRVGGP